MKRLTFLILAVLVALAALSGLLQQAAAVSPLTPTLMTNGDKIDPALQTAFSQAADRAPVRFIVDFNTPPGSTAVSRLSDPTANRAALLTTLHQIHNTTLTAVQPVLDQLQAAGEIGQIQPLWLVNSVAVSGTAAAAATLAARADVAYLRLDNARPAYDPPEMRFNLDASRLTGALDTGVTAWGVARIGADKVWQALSIDGSGVTIAFVDSGVDWQHPDLLPNYRGNLQDGTYNHADNWYYTLDPSVTAPFDVIGHGTHVAGTAVGQNGIGVAPGAQWIAVNVVDSSGFIYDSNIHAAYAWLLAPNGKPELAPDIINNSWSGVGNTTTFVEDIDILHAAGIMTIFSAGNSGPQDTTVGSPASYTSTLAVGASDDIDRVAWFSSRGPSPITSKQKPWVIAPGTSILSAYPGGAYAYYNGTSMSAPHVTGAAALLLAVNPALTLPDIEQILAETAVPVAAIHPNPDSGWGRIDAYAAVAAQLNTGIIHGVVTVGGEQAAAARVTFTRADGFEVLFAADENGRYHAILPTGSYTLTAAAYGAVTTTVAPTALATGSTVPRNINLPRQPGGLLTGVITGADGRPALAQLVVRDTPLKTATDSSGRYTLHLPPGFYKIDVSAFGHMGQQLTTAVASGDTHTHNLQLANAPRLLLVDSGQWYFDSQASYYLDALRALNQTSHVWTIRDPFTDLPTAADLRAYDAVIWSNPQDSPGYLGLGTVISDYLGTGGNLLISGQNVGLFDGTGFGLQWWWYALLDATFLNKVPNQYWLYGQSGTHFENIYLTLNGGNSASNQFQTDAAAPRPGTLTEPIFHYNNGVGAGLQAGRCDPYRIVYLGFGLEGVRDGQTRSTLIDRSLDYFAAPPAVSGLRWEETAVFDYTLPGDELVYTLTLRNLSETLTDTVQLAVTSTAWPTQLVTRTLQLGPCQRGDTVLRVPVPPDAAMDATHELKVTAVSGNFGHIRTSLTMTHKTPGHILLVDDDRFYNREAEYEAALQAMGLSYDVWDVGWDNNTFGLIRQELLNAYDIVLWYTGYDWFAPVERAERERLTNYLAQNGRLFLSSQDFLFYNHRSPLARTYLDMPEYRESVTPTQIIAADWSALSPEMGQFIDLNYKPYINNGDGLIPGAASRPFLWHNQGAAAAIATTGSGWRSVFWGIPWETIPAPLQATAMHDVVAWLSDVGDSELAVDGRTTTPASRHTYTLTIANDATAPANTIAITNTLPPELTLLPDTLTGQAELSADGRTITWQGVVSPGDRHTITYAAEVAAGLRPGTPILNEAFIHYGRHHMTVRRVAQLWVNAPDFSGSWLAATAAPPAPVQTVTYTLWLQNRGAATTEPVTAVLRLPDTLLPLTPTLTLSSGAAVWEGQHITWTGRLIGPQTALVTAVFTRSMAVTPLWLPATAVIMDGITPPTIRDDLLYLPPYQQILPLLLHFADAP